MLTSTIIAFIQVSKDAKRNLINFLHSGNKGWPAEEQLEFFDIFDARISLTRKRLVTLHSIDQSETLSKCSSYMSNIAAILSLFC